MKIADYDHPLRKLVTSESDAAVSYLVDLSDPEFPAGRCDCEDYQIRIEPFVTRGEMPDCSRLSCKHIDATVAKLLAELRKTAGGTIRFPKRKPAGKPVPRRSRKLKPS